MLGNAAPSEEQRVAAALLFAGPRAIVTGLEACRRHGLRQRELPDEHDLHVLVPHGHKLLSSGFVTVERTHRMPSNVVHDGVALAPLVRAALDAARRIRDSESVSKLLVEAIQRGRCSPQALSKELEVGGQRGTALPRRLLKEVVDLRSIAELHGKKLSDKLGTRPTHRNVDLFDESGKYVGRPDGWWDDVGLAWEIDSLNFHLGAADYSRTLERNTRYAAAGITVVQTLPSRILHDEAGVLSDLEAAYHSASRTPRPPVRLAVDSS